VAEHHATTPVRAPCESHLHLQLSAESRSARANSKTCSSEEVCVLKVSNEFDPVYGPVSSSFVFSRTDYRLEDRRLNDLSELFLCLERTSLQSGLQKVRLLFELFGFLLKAQAGHLLGTHL
jgi:hypothetical protein